MDFPVFETVRWEDKWLLVFLYSYQIYADFFGYTAIAIGLGLLFGYRLPIDFQSALHLGVVFRILDAVAHVAFKLAPHLSLHPARRQSARQPRERTSISWSSWASAASGTVPH